MEQFENMTIGQLKVLTEEFKRLQEENKVLRAKFPTKKITERGASAQELVDGC